MVSYSDQLQGRSTVRGSSLLDEAESIQPSDSEIELQAQPKSLLESPTKSRRRDIACCFLGSAAGMLCALIISSLSYDERVVHRRSPEQGPGGPGGPLAFGDFSSDQNATEGVYASPVSDAPLLEFYVYRAQSEAEYNLENINAANLPGVMWYLHHEIVHHCPRKFDITRIKRLRVRTRATKELFHLANNKYRMNFGFRYAYDFGRCSGKSSHPGKYGYVVGCNKFEDRYPYPDHGAGFLYEGGIWYSFPGKCPSQPYPLKTQSCAQREPGGRCAYPTGAHDCTWSMTDAGHISIDELTGAKGGKYGCNYHGFWNQPGSSAANKARVQKALQMFQQKYPDLPADLPDPECDYNRHY